MKMHLRESRTSTFSVGAELLLLSTHLGKNLLKPLGKRP